VVEHERGLGVLLHQAERVGQLVGVAPDLEAQAPLGDRGETFEERGVAQQVRLVGEVTHARIGMVGRHAPHAVHQRTDLEMLVQDRGGVVEARVGEHHEGPQRGCAVLAERE
jgi:hypothetical protein